VQASAFYARSNTLIKFIRSLNSSFWSLFFPRLCLCCEQGLPPDDEEYICFTCRVNLPYTNFHLLPENTVTDRLAGRIPLVFGAAYFFYRPDSRAQQVINALKYYNRPEIGTELGQAYGMDLLEVAQLQDADYIVPVPLHPKRMHQRGYNQAEKFGAGLAEKLPAQLLVDGLVRRSFEESQTKKGLEDRIKNVENAFGVGKHDLSNLHIILVDDILTTGATLESCADALLEAYPSARLSLVTIGFVE
jgi:ComF family protein